ncbi:protein IQ-DOMAIN 1-like [Durio zibethinus]|uniref:Protein IQ-DOMAIN 1-like n=1 Tax=Durio zibethinus TaxID=66656 RepID=A0A6P6AKE5_DURZI|nr:protein IQ-DOMAIN 1-like [Durio zibethinus]XP_022765339.1 protein IQ-DOMAIN 1-like [Durio zibethinus]
MGKKEGWFSVVKRVLSPESKKDQKTPKSKKKWFGKSKDLGPVSLPEETEVTALPPPTEDVKLTDAENEQSKHAYSVALATAMAAEAAVAAAQAAVEVVRLTSVPRYPGKSKEEIAAIKIQTAFRGYLARRALRALRGLVRLKSLIQGQSVKRQATTTLRCMQTLAHVQAQIRARRIRMSEENQALQWQLQQKREKELEKLRASMGEDWNDSTQSKEQIEARQQNKQEAAMRRERALAYAFSRQQSWKNCSRSVNQTFMDPSNPHWGWSWLERWMAARPWEIRSTTDNNDRGSVKSMGACSMSIGEISRAYSRRDLNNDNNPSPKPPKSSQPRSHQSPSTPPSKAPSISSVSSKRRMPSPRGSQWGGDEDSRSILSVQSDRYRRHSIAGSSVRDNESLASSPAIPSYMTPTQSAKARSRLPSPLGLEKNRMPERGLAGSAKKRLSFPASPANNRRYSGPPEVDITLIKDIKMQKGLKWSNVGGR